MYSSLQDARKFYPLARDLSATTYQDRLLKIGLPASAAFLAEFEDHAERGAMRGYLLFHRGQPIAYGYCAATGDCLRFIFTGYDPAFAAGLVTGHRPRPRDVALDLQRRTLCHPRSRARRGPVQASFRDRLDPLRHLAVFRPTLGHLTKVVAHRSCIAASDLCAAAAERLGVKEQLRRLVRTRTLTLGAPLLGLAVRDISHLWPVCDVAQQLIETLP